MFYEECYRRMKYTTISAEMPWVLAVEKTISSSSPIQVDVNYISQKHQEEGGPMAQQPTLSGNTIPGICNRMHWKAPVFVGGPQDVVRKIIFKVVHLGKCKNRPLRKGWASHFDPVHNPLEMALPATFVLANSFRLSES